MTDKRMSDERLAKLREIALNLPFKEVAELIAEIGAIRAELAMAKAVADMRGMLPDALKAQVAKTIAAERERDSARADALEEAAKVADAERGRLKNGGAINACDAIAKAIRALKPTQAPER